MNEKKVNSIPTFSISGCLFMKTADLAGQVPDNNRDLILLCKEGDRVAQYRLYKQYAHPMYNLCVRMVVDRMEAEDLLQEVFVKIFREIRRFRGECTPGAWMRRIVINHCLNHLRRKRIVFQNVESLEKEDEPDEPDYPEVSPELINRSIGELPEGARVVLVLFLLEGYRHADIAAMLGISESTSKSQYRRALKLLREKFNVNVTEDWDERKN